MSVFIRTMAFGMDPGCCLPFVWPQNTIKIMKLIMYIVHFSEENTDGSYMDDINFCPFVCFKHLTWPLTKSSLI
jgi:hypothetical protein